MAGSPIKTARNRVARESLLNAAIDRAIIDGYEHGCDPVKLMKPVAKALYEKALEGDVAAIKEVFDRVDGRVVQDVMLEGGDGVPGITITILQVPTQERLSAGLTRLIEAEVLQPINDEEKRDGDDKAG